MYRPKGWKTLKAKNHPLHCLAPDECVGASFEAGADAMLEGLRKGGIFGEYHQKGIYRGIWVTEKSTSYMVCDNFGTYPLDVGVGGTLVFIPDEVK